MSKSQTDLVKDVVINKEFFPDESSVDYTIENVTLSDSTLVMNIKYKGGCGEHQFDLIFNGMYMKSLPMQAGLFLRHTSESEKCDMEISETLKFNVSPVASTGYQTIILVISKFDQKIKYDY